MLGRRPSSQLSGVQVSLTASAVVHVRDAALAQTWQASSNRTACVEAITQASDIVPQPELFMDDVVQLLERRGVAPASLSNATLAAAWQSDSSLPSGSCLTLERRQKSLAMLVQTSDEEVAFALAQLQNLSRIDSVCTFQCTGTVLQLCELVQGALMAGMMLLLCDGHRTTIGRLLTSRSSSN